MNERSPRIGGRETRFVPRPITGQALAPVPLPGRLRPSSGSDDLLKILWQSRWLMLLSVTLALVGGILYLRFATPVYRSSSRLYIQQNVPPILRFESGGPQRYNLYTQAALLSSTRILNAALQTPELRALNVFAHKDNPLACLEQNLKVSTGRNDDIITVSFSCPYPAEAAQVVNSVVGAFMDDHEKNQRQTSADVLEGLKRSRDQMMQELDQKRRERADLQKNSMLLAVGSTSGGTVIQEVQELERLSTALTDARIETAGAETFRKAVADRAQTPALLREYISSPRGVGPPSAADASAGQRAALVTLLFDLQSRRRGLLNSNLTARHPQVRTVDEEIRQVEAKLAALDSEFVATQLAAAEQHYVDAQRREEQMNRLVEGQRQSAMALNKKLVDYQLLDAKEKELATYLQTVDQKIRDLRVSEDLELEPLRIRVMEVARPPAAPSEPQANKAMAVALVLGVLSGGCLAVVRGWLDQTLRSADEISELFGLPVLGVVPAMSRRETPQVRGQRVHRQPDSQEAEAFRTVRTAIFFGAANREQAKTFLVTSPSPGDGKSTVVSNLGIAMAQAGQRTLILDADFRKPMQHVLFGINQDEGGIGGVLAGKVKVRDAIRSTPVKGLNLLANGAWIPNPAETLNSPRFAKLLTRLADVYDRILVDAPPVTAVTDAQILGAICHQTILVLQTNKSTKKLSRRAVEAMEGVGVHFLGVVVNNVRREGSRYGHYGAYGGYYRSDRGREKSAGMGERHAGNNGKRWAVRLIGGGGRLP